MPAATKEEKPKLVLRAEALGPRDIMVRCTEDIAAFTLGQLPGGDQHGGLVVIITLKGIVEKTKTVKLSLKGEASMQISQTRPAREEAAKDPQQTLVKKEFTGKRFERPGFWWARPIDGDPDKTPVIAFVWSTRYDGSDRLQLFAGGATERIEDWEPIARIVNPEA